MRFETKMEKTDHVIGYQWHPRGSQRCANCTMFVAPAGCTAVVGEISPNGWCHIHIRAKEPR